MRWFAEQGALVGEQVDVALDVTELFVGERVEPDGDLGFEFDRTPGHSRDAIGPSGGGGGPMRHVLVARATNCTDWTDQPDATQDWRSRQYTRQHWLDGSLHLFFAKVRVAGSNPVVRSTRSGSSGFYSSAARTS